MASLGASLAQLSMSSATGSMGAAVGSMGGGVSGGGIGVGIGGGGAFAGGGSFGGGVSFGVGAIVGGAFQGALQGIANDMAWFDAEFGTEIDAITFAVTAAGAAMGNPLVVGVGLGVIGLRSAFGIGAAARGVVGATGQLHHAISRPIARALDQHPSLAGKYVARDPTLTTRAVDQAAHRGYQDWHRRLDREVVDWLRGNPRATPQEFESYLRTRYSQPDLVERFPAGLL